MNVGRVTLAICIQNRIANGVFFSRMRENNQKLVEVDVFFARKRTY